MRPRLGVNVDHVATVRQARRASYPDPVEAALVCERAGADQITVHLREDRRHIQDRDVEILRRVVKTELNLEMAATPEMQRIALALRPELVTLVPERREEVTTEGGLDAAGRAGEIAPIVAALSAAKIRVSLFIDADLAQIAAARAMGADAIEIHTGRYAEARGAEQAEELARIERAARAGEAAGLFVAAGHGLHYTNTAPIARVAEIRELNIGHAIVARAILDGLDRAVRDMLHCMSAARM